MFRHGSSCLLGPVSRWKEWWLAAEQTAAESVPPPRSRWRRPRQQRPPRSLAPDASIRSELVERVRQELAAGVYETHHKWELALERLFERLEAD